MSRSGNGVEVRDTSIRRRRAYAARHTYCTSLLMAWVQPAYIAAQAGHSVEALLEVYSRWLPGADGADGSRFWETGREESRMKFEVQRVEYPTPKVKFLVEVDLAEVAGMRLDAFDRSLLEDVGSDANATPADQLLLLEMLFRRRQEERKVG